MKAAVLLAIVAPLLGQTLPPSPRDLLDTARPLTSAEITLVVDATRAALADRTIHMSSLSGGHVADVLVGQDGRPKLVRSTGGVEGGTVSGTVSGASGTSGPPARTFWHEETTTIVDYTGRPVTHCDGSLEPGEMVIAYEWRSSTRAWTTTARRRSARDVLGVTSAFEMLQSAATIARGEQRQIDAHQARALVSPWTPPPDRFGRPAVLTGDPAPDVAGDPAPHGATQSLWIDTDSLLPLRWETFAPGAPAYGFTFAYTPIDLRPPAGVEAPDCVR
jgi:hypothetical protein